MDDNHSDPPFAPQTLKDFYKIFDGSQARTVLTSIETNARGPEGKLSNNVSTCEHGAGGTGASSAGTGRLVNDTQFGPKGGARSCTP